MGWHPSWRTSFGYFAATGYLLSMLPSNRGWSNWSLKKRFSPTIQALSCPTPTENETGSSETKLTGAGPTKTGPIRARPTGAGSIRAGPTGAGPTGAGPTGTGRNRARLTKACPTWAVLT